MPDDDASASRLKHLAGLAAAGGLAAACWWVWSASYQLAEFIGVPELHVLVALSGAILVLTLAQLAFEIRE